MSQSRIDKLRRLLSRVEQRRAAPRLTAIPGSAGPREPGAADARGPAREPSGAGTGPKLVSSEPAPYLREVPPAPAAKVSAPLEQAPAREVPSSMPPPAAARSEAPIPTSLPPAPVEAPAAERKPPSSTVPPPTQTDLVARAGTEVLPPVPARVAPSPALPFDSAVQVVSSPRIDAPKSFGELLEQSLALRPRASDKA